MLNPAASEYLAETCRLAGAEILDVYGRDFEVSNKADRSPVTEADLRAHRVIVRRLRERWPDVPILSEESSSKAEFEIRRQWVRFWLVDPLDGTKEFIKRNGQFTVNIALIEGCRPVAGWVYAPASRTFYWSVNGTAAWKRTGDGEAVALPSQTAPPDTRRIVGSLSHPSPQLEAFVAQERLRYKHVDFVPMGSSLKICLVAEGAADVYPRFGPTMEWDTAAAHAVANAAGRRVIRHDSDEELIYNKPDLHNPWFVVR